MKPSAILTADIHLREKPPKNRIDDYFAAQEKKITFIKDLHKRFNVPILDAGDLFHKWNSAPYLEAWAIRNLPNIHTIPGNHELESHNIKNLERSSLFVLYEADRILLLNGRSEVEMEERYLTGDISICAFDWGTPLKSYKEVKSSKKPGIKRAIAIIHYMVTDERLKYENKESMSGHAILRKMKGFDLILSGHNHKSFVIEQEGRLLVNPGSMMRMSKNQIDHKPRVYLWDKDTNEVEPVFLPIEDNVFAVKKIEEEEKKNKYLDSYVTALNNEYEVTLQFKKNLENYFKENKTRKPVEELVWDKVP